MKREPADKTGVERVPQSRFFHYLPVDNGGVRGGISRFDPVDSNAEAKRSSAESS